MMEHARIRLLRPSGYAFRLAQYVIVLLLAAAGSAWAAGMAPPDQPMTCQSTDTPALAVDWMSSAPTPIGPGDTIAITVDGQADLTGTQVVAPDGTIRLVLVHQPLRVGGLSAPEAASVVARALRDGKLVLDPGVTVKVVKSVNDLVAILGEVRKPDRYPIQSGTTLFDLLALAGGATDNASDVVCVSRTLANGSIARRPIPLRSIEYDRTLSLRLRGGDSIFVEPAAHFWILGQVKAPSKYLLVNGMTVGQALAAAGGITELGSMHRIVIRRPTGPKSYKTLHVRLSDPIEPDDLVIVRESIF